MWLWTLFRLFFFGSREKNVLALGRQLESHVCIDDIFDEEINALTWLLLVEEGSWFCGWNSSWATNNDCMGFCQEIWNNRVFMALWFGFLSLVSAKGSEIVPRILIPTLLDGCERLFFFGSQEENVLAVGRQLELHECIDYIYDEL